MNPGPLRGTTLSGSRASPGKIIAHPDDPDSPYSGDTAEDAVYKFTVAIDGATADHFWFKNGTRYDNVGNGTGFRASNEQRGQLHLQYNQAFVKHFAEAIDKAGLSSYWRHE